MTDRTQSAGESEVHLTGVRAEFRTALREEIKAASRHASANATQLVGGRRIARIGGAYQYLFTVQNALNVPGDTPGDLHVPGHGPIQVTVISIEGLAITLSVAEDLGEFVPTARLVSDLTFLMRRLIERIEAIGDGPNPAGERARGAAPVSGRPAAVGPSHFDLNPEQMRAVSSSLGRNTTFVHGPPGTGKTQTIGAVVEQLYRQGRTVLLVSHTNSAVDQALIKVGEALGEAEISLGLVLRVGEPRDLRLDAELRLDTHVTRRSSELMERKESLTTQRDAAVIEVMRLTRLIELCEWVDEGERDLHAMERELKLVQEMEGELEQLQGEKGELLRSLPEWERAAEAAQEVAASAQRLEGLEGEIADGERVLSRLQDEIADLERQMRSARVLLSQAEGIEPLRVRAAALPSAQEQEQHVGDARAAAAAAYARRDTVAARLSEAQRVYRETTSVGGLVRMWRRLPKSEAQREVVALLQREVDESASALEEARAALASAESMLAEASALAEQLGPYAGVPDVMTQRKVLAGLEARLASRRQALDAGGRSLGGLLAEKEEHSAALEEFRSSYSGDPDVVTSRATAHSHRLSEVTELVSRVGQECRRRRAELEEVVGVRLAAVQAWGLADGERGPAESMLVTIQEAHATARLEVSALNAKALRGELAEFNRQITFLDSEIAGIDQALQKVEQILIEEARVLGTTLTRAYVRDEIQSRTFDTVILDEASIAPIPALWVAGSRAHANVVVVGDPEQLPPIVISDNAVAWRWLGRDILKVADVSSETEHAVMLVWQNRMRPEISAIPNALVYGGRLRNADFAKSDGSDLKRWYGGHEEAVLLVDTGPLDAWVTSVPRGARASRLNFLSAAVCVDLVEQMLRPDRPSRVPGDDHRALIVCPYWAQAKLLDLLLCEQGLTDDVVAGTVHNFQGTEADVVLFDLVNDEPHWQVGMFMAARDDTTKPLLNVAMTRARSRLVLVGDFDYVAKQARKAFLGRELLPFLDRCGYRRIDARELVADGISARAAQAQAKVYPRPARGDAPHLIVRQDHFYPLLCNDLAVARRRVVIYSAFITRNRLSLLGLHLQAAADRDVSLFVVTRTLEERSPSERQEYRFLERTLEDWGVVIIHKRHMHEKLIFIDDDIIWEGSLNALSATGGSEEVMERRVSRSLSSEFARTVRLPELLGAYEGGTPSCPICREEIVASEGREKPFYWRCTDESCGYTRDMDVAPPTDGLKSLLHYRNNSGKRPECLRKA